MHVIASHDGVVGATVQEKAGVESVIHVVVGDVDMIAAFGRDDAVVA